MFGKVIFVCYLFLGIISSIGLPGQDVNYFKIIDNAREIAKQSQQFSHRENANREVLSGLFPRRKNHDVTARAEEILSSELEDNWLYNVSTPCLNHTKVFLSSLISGERWAWRMLDSMGKPESGILDGNTRWVGGWEECRDVEASVTISNGTEVLHPYKGKFCYGVIPIPSLASQGYGAMGMCFPDSCSQDDASALFRTFTSLLPVAVPLGGCQCKENSIEYSNKAIAVTVVCSIFLVIITIATAYDILIQHFISPRSEKMHNKRQSFGKVTGQKAANGHISETTSLLDDSYQKDMVSHSNDDIKKILYETKKFNNTKKTPTVLDKINDKHPHGFMWRILLSFSVYTNVKKLLNTNTPAGTLTSVNGVRFISMTWVILGHTYYFGLSVTDNAVTFLPRMFKRFSFQAIANETVAVDTFFVLSGLLVSYLTLREIKKRGGVRRFNWFLFYFHRYWRLTPPYMLFLMLYVPTMRYYADGPFWMQEGFETNECKASWWTNLLYVNNLVKTDDGMCMGWTWYLANDMQFYIISPLMLIPLYYSNMAGGIVCFLFAVGNFIASGLFSKHSSLQANILFDANAGTPDAPNDIYMKPWYRVGPYAVGIYTGYLLYKSECKMTLPKTKARLLNVVAWTIATAFAMLVLYGLYKPDGDQTIDLDLAAFYNATARTAWGIAIAWVVYACATGYGGPVNAILSWKGIIPLSRLTYCAYLVHPVVMLTYYYSRRTLIHFYDLNMVYLFLGNMCMSYAVAFVVSLAFESPMIGLEKVLLGREKNS